MYGLKHQKEKRSMDHFSHTLMSKVAHRDQSLRYNSLVATGGTDGVIGRRACG